MVYATKEDLKHHMVHYDTTTKKIFHIYFSIHLNVYSWFYLTLSLTMVE